MGNCLCLFYIIRKLQIVTVKIIWMLTYIQALKLITWDMRKLPANINLFKVNNRNTRKMCEICSKLTIKTPERRQWRRSGAFIVDLNTFVNFSFFKNHFWIKTFPLFQQIFTSECFISSVLLIRILKKISALKLNCDVYLRAALTEGPIK